MSASRRSLPPDPASAVAAQYSLSNHASPASSASFPGFGQWENVHERIQETVEAPTHVAETGDESASDLRSAEDFVPTEAVRPDGVETASHRGSLTTGTAANGTTAPGIPKKNSASRSSAG